MCNIEGEREKEREKERERESYTVRKREIKKYNKRNCWRHSCNVNQPELLNFVRGKSLGK